MNIKALFVLPAALVLIGASPKKMPDPHSKPLEAQAENLRANFNELEYHMRRNAAEYKDKLGPVSERLGELEERVDSAKTQEELDHVRSDFRSLRRELHQRPGMADELK